MILPKSYLSYSAASLWYSSKSAYRSRYYYNAPSISSVQTDYGKEVADLLKADDPSVAHVPKLPIRDEGFTVDISGVPVLMYPDSLSIDGIPSFLEYKSGVDAWTQENVDNHMQLKLYSLGIKEKYGAVNDICKLLWLVTEMVDLTDPIYVNGKRYETTIQVPRMTGEINIFETVINDMERFRARQWIVGAAAEISADYKAFLKLSPSTVDSSQVA
jgi:hypothetical protein